MNIISPRVSVLVPAYNVASSLPALRQAMESQSFTDWELIVVDDRSSDDTLAVARRWEAEDPRVRVLARTMNSGAPITPRVDAARLARAPWIVPLDADDVVSDDYLETLLRRADATDAEIVLPMMINCRDKDEASIFRDELLDASLVYSGRDLVIHTLYTWDFGCNGALCDRRIYRLTLDNLLTIPLPADVPAPHYPAAANPFMDEVGTRALLLAASKVAFAPDARYYYMPNPQSVVETPRSFYIGIEADIWLRELIERAYPEGSPERRRLDLHCGVHLAACLGRYYRERRTMAPERREELWSLLRDAWRRFPRRAYRALSPAYRATLSLGPRAASLIFGLAKK